MMRSTMRQKLVTLALQGGGSHGAFTWGVLDRLLEDDRIDFEAVSGASAGAINAVVLAHGFSVRGRDGAREALASFWKAVSEKTAFASVPITWPATVAPGSPALAPGLTALIYLSRFLAPYQFNPFKLNPLRDLLAEHVDFERLRVQKRIKLFIAATQISTGRLKLFSNEEIVLEALLASACIPTLHRRLASTKLPSNRRALVFRSDGTRVLSVQDRLISA